MSMEPGHSAIPHRHILRRADELTLTTLNVAHKTRLIRVSAAVAALSIGTVALAAPAWGHVHVASFMFSHTGGRQGQRPVPG